MKQQKKIHRIYLDAELNLDSYTCNTELSHRILNVLRIKNNETLSIFNHREEYLATVSIDKKHVILNLTEKIINKDDESRTVTLGVSIVNMKLMDLIIQKSVELGVTNFSPIYTQEVNIKVKITSWIIG